MQFIEQSRLDRYGLLVAFILISTTAIVQGHKLARGLSSSSFCSLQSISRYEITLFCLP